MTTPYRLLIPLAATLLLLTGCARKADEERSSAGPATTPGAQDSSGRNADPGTPGQGTQGQGAADRAVGPTAMERSRQDSLRAAGNGQSEAQVSETEALARCQTLGSHARAECSLRVRQGFDRVNAPAQSLEAGRETGDRRADTAQAPQGEQQK